MEFYVFAAFILLSILSLYLSSLTAISLFRDSTLNPTQRIAQLFVSLLIPIFGSVLVLHLIAQHSPEVIPDKFLPWPLRSFVFGNHQRRNRNRNENIDNAVDLSIVARREQRLDEGNSHSTSHNSSYNTSHTGD